MRNSAAGSHILAVRAGEMAQIRRKTDYLKTLFLPFFIDHFKQFPFKRKKVLFSGGQFYVLWGTDESPGKESYE
jgi:hypothetical protein